MGIFRVRIILGGNFPGGSYPGWELSGGNHPGGNFPGGNFPSTENSTTYIFWINF